MYPFRIFISYSHEDRQSAHHIVRTLRDLGLTPVYDDDIRPGIPFTDTIKEQIGRSHLFMPIMTQNSQQRAWVHQEIGYALGLNLPVLPLSIGDLPSQMIAPLQALCVDADLNDLPARLLEADLEQLVCSVRPRPRGLVEIAEWPETRCEWLSEFACRVAELGGYGYVRQRGPLSTFALPDIDVDDPFWERRDGKGTRGRFYRHLRREERRALEIHARGAGCRLIIDHTMDFGGAQPADVVEARLTTLYEFLDSMPDDKVEIVSCTRARGGNLTIIGDWFVAESMVPRATEGYRQTVFNWHAPSVLYWLRRFDREFERLCKDNGVEPGTSRTAVMRQIKMRLK